MTLPTSGKISLSAINTELGKSPTTSTSLNKTENRTLAAKPSGKIKFSDFYGKSNYPVSGTLLNTYCSGYDQYGTYANGSGGSYNSLIQANSASCGYVAPVYNETVDGTPNPAPASPSSADRRQIAWRLRGGVPNTGFSTNNAGSGTLNELGNADVYQLTPVSSTNTTMTTVVTFAGTGHTVTASVSVTGPVYNEAISMPASVSTTTGGAMHITGGMPYVTFTWSTSGPSSASGTDSLDANGSFYNPSAFMTASPPGVYTYTATFSGTSHVRSVTVTVTP